MPKRRSSPVPERETRSKARRKSAPLTKEVEVVQSVEHRATPRPASSDGQLPPDVEYFPDFLEDVAEADWYERLAALDTYRPTLKVYGKSVIQSRAIAAYATEPVKVKYSGTEVDVHVPFPPVVDEICARVEGLLGEKFNHVMLNRYDDGSVYIGRHSDTAENGVIAAVSLGAKRRMVFAPRLPPRVVLTAAEKRELEARKVHKMILKNGSLLVMRPPTQDFWKHEIPREPACKEGRISLTFRQLPPAT